MPPSDVLFTIPKDLVISDPVIMPQSEVYDASLSLLGVFDAWKESRGKGVTVAVLDTGFDVDHPDLKHKILSAENYTNSAVGVRDGGNPHGTHTAGLVGAETDNDVGMKSIAPMTGLHLAKVLGDDGTGTEDSIFKGLKTTIEKYNPDVLSLSWGGPFMGASVEQLLREFTAQPGHFVIAAAGNSGEVNGDTINKPGRYNFVCCVAAVYYDETTKHWQRTLFSSRGSIARRPDLAAPGKDILSTVPVSLGSYRRMSGTSMATPFVTGCVALALAKHKAYETLTGKPHDLKTPRALVDHLKRACAPLNDLDTGLGVIQPHDLVSFTHDPTEPDEPTN